MLFEKGDGGESASPRQKSAETYIREYGGFYG